MSTAAAALAWPVTGAAAPKPGFYRDVPFNDYASWQAVNSGILSCFARTPAHVLHELLHGGVDRTPSLDLGWLTHLAVLEPERFEGGVVVPPKVDRRTKEGKAEWARFEAGHAGKQFVKADDYAATLAMRQALLAHPTAGEFFQGRGVNEVSIVWVDEETGLPQKARIDRVGFIGEYPVVADLKTAHDAARRTFERAVYSYNYFIQAAHYLRGLQALIPVPVGNPYRRFVFFVVESDPPHCVALYELEDLAIAEGERLRRRYLNTFKRCCETGVFPGYPDGIDICGLPAWAYKTFESD